jgi:4a-hydroxytetrahydrobiopterin dehydratase
VSDRVLGPRDVEAEGLPDWRVLGGALHARFRTGDFATGLRLVDLVGAAADELDHHPDLDLRYPHLDVRLSSHDVGGITGRDVRLARRISELAAAAGATAEPSVLSVLEIALDSEDPASILPFWRAVLGLRAAPGRDDELVDPTGAFPTLWFQQTVAHESPRQRFHLDVSVPPEAAGERVAAALAAGGTLVSDERAPAYWVLADAQGNKACVCTWQGRD